MLGPLGEGIYKNIHKMPLQINWLMCRIPLQYQNMGNWRHLINLQVAHKRMGFSQVLFKMFFYGICCWKKLWKLVTHTVPLKCYGTHACTTWSLLLHHLITSSWMCELALKEKEKKFWSEEPLSVIIYVQVITWHYSQCKMMWIYDQP